MSDDNAAAGPDDGTGGDSPEHIQAMLDRADGKVTPAASETDGDQLLAGKYKTQEDLVKGYLELQKAYSQRDPNADPGEDSGKAEGEDSGDDGSDPADTKLPDRKDLDAGDPDGIDFGRYSQSIADTGELSEADYKELADKHNLPKEIVDVYVDGLKSRIETRGNTAADAVGGRESFEAIRTWAAESLPEAEYNTVQQAIQSATSDAAVALIYRTLQTQYNDANPGEATLIAGDGAGKAVTGFRSVAEQTAAINDPRYDKDSAYRADVEKKIGNSTF